MKIDPNQFSKSSRLMGDFAQGAFKTAIATGGSKMLFRAARKIPGPIGWVAKLAVLAAPVLITMLNRKRDQSAASSNTPTPLNPALQNFNPPRESVSSSYSMHFVHQSSGSEANISGCFI